MRRSPGIAPTSAMEAIGRPRAFSLPAPFTCVELRQQSFRSVHVLQADGGSGGLHSGLP